MEEGLRFENSLSDEALHALFWDLGTVHVLILLTNRVSQPGYYQGYKQNF